MKLVTFEQDGAPRAGIWLGSEIVDIRKADPSLPADMLGLLRGGDRMMERLRGLSGSAVRVKAADVRLLAPVPRPGKILCIGQNYLDHCREQNLEPPTSPILFAKYNNTVTHPGDPVRLPSLSDQVDYEAELALVIGKTGSAVPEDRALEHVAGYTCINDISARDIQFADKQWTRGKSFDTFLPMGPCLVTRDEIPDPQALGIRCVVNGEALQDSTTSYMIFNCAYLIACLSRSITLEPGDLIATGTPNGVGVFRKPPRFLKGGDRVTVSIERIGDLSNPIEA